MIIIIIILILGFIIEYKYSPRFEVYESINDNSDENNGIKEHCLIWYNDVSQSNIQLKTYRARKSIKIW